MEMSTGDAIVAVSVIGSMGLFVVRLGSVANKLMEQFNEGQKGFLEVISKLGQKDGNGVQHGITHQMLTNQQATNERIEETLGEIRDGQHERIRIIEKYEKKLSRREDD